MKTIQIEIDCTDKYCNKIKVCQLFDEWDESCFYFGKLKKGKSGWLRCKECLEAEVKDVVL